MPPEYNHVVPDVKPTRMGSRELGWFLFAIGIGVALKFYRDTAELPHYSEYPWVYAVAFGGSLVGLVIAFAYRKQARISSPKEPKPPQSDGVHRVIDFLLKPSLGRGYDLLFALVALGSIFYFPLWYPDANRWLIMLLQGLFLLAGLGFTYRFFSPPKSTKVEG